MAIHWAAVMLAWLAGIAVQLQQSELMARAWPWGLAGMLPVLAWHVWPGAREALMRKARARWGVAGAIQLRRWVGVGLACLAAAALGWAQTQWRSQRLAVQVWPEAWAARADEVWLTGQVVEMPGKQPWGWSAKVRVQTWQVGDATWAAGQAWAGSQADERLAPRLVSVRMGPDLPEPVPGDIWRWPVRMGQALGQSNPGGFDLDLWLWEQGVRAVGQVDAKREPPVLIRAATAWSPGVVERWRTRLRQRILGHVQQERVAGMVRGLTIGEQGAISQADWDALRLSATAHLAAISGLHITLMGAMVGGLAGWWWRRAAWRVQWCPAPTVARWSMLVGACLYALIAGWGVPAQRTVWMLLVVVLLRSSGRRWPWPLTLLMAAVVVTALDPWALVSVGFWLSFVAVAVLMWGGADTVVVPGSSRWAQWRHAAQELWRTQRLATVGLAPLSLVFFQSVSWVGLGVNLVCIPWFTLVLTPMAMLGLCCPWVWRVLEPLMLFTLDTLHEVALPWLQWQVPAVSPWAAALAVLGGAWLLAPLGWRWRAWALPALLPLLWPTSLSRTLPAPAESELDLIAADVGQGSAVLLRTARHAMLFDTGPVSRSGDDAGRRVLVGLMRAAGVQSLDTLMLSHGDADHTGGAASVLKAMSVQVVHGSLAPSDSLRQLRDARGALPQQKACEAGQSWVWDGVRFEVIYPLRAFQAEGEVRKDNEMSCVLRVRARERQVLITGDIEAAQEAELVARQGRIGLASEVLLVPHHGSKTSSTLPFLQAVQPRVAVVQVGARNAYGHPNPKVMARYSDEHVPTVLTPLCGAWWWQSVRPAGPSTERPATCWREVGRRYWSHLDSTLPER